MLLFSSHAQIVLSFLHTGVLAFLFLLFFVRNVVVSVLLLVCIFIGSAIGFMFFNAVYLSLVLIIVYIGAIAVLFLFVIMLTNKVYTVRHSFQAGFFMLSVGLILFEFLFFLGFNFFGTGIFWLEINHAGNLLGDLPQRFFFFSDPLGRLGFLFFNFFSFYLVGLGVLLLLVLVGVVLLLRGALGNTLIIDRSFVRESLRWRRLLAFRHFVPLKTTVYDSARNSN